MTSDISVTPQVEPGLGRKGEVSEMINKNLSLTDAADLMCKNWNFGRLDPAHEVAHVPLALLSHTHPDLIKGASYQGDNAIEPYADAIQRICEQTLASPKIQLFQNKGAFIDHVIEKSRLYYDATVQGHIVDWVLAQAAGKSVAEFKEESGYESRVGQQPRMKITGVGGKTTVIDSFDHGTFLIDAKNQTLTLPKNLKGSEPLTIYTIPSAAEVGKFYEALLPAIHVIQKKIGQLRSNFDGDCAVNTATQIAIFSQIRSADLIEAIETDKARLERRKELDERYVHMQAVVEAASPIDTPREKPVKEPSVKPFMR